jgi:hypothetical protein
MPKFMKVATTDELEDQPSWSKWKARRSPSFAWEKRSTR